MAEFDFRFLKVREMQERKPQKRILGERIECREYTSDFGEELIAMLAEDMRSLFGEEWVAECSEDLPTLGGYVAMTAGYNAAKYGRQRSICGAVLCQTAMDARQPIDERLLDKRTAAKRLRQFRKVNPDAYLERNGTTEVHDGDLFIRNIYVSPDMRRKKIATTLVNLVTDSTLHQVFTQVPDIDWCVKGMEQLGFSVLLRYGPFYPDRSGAAFMYRPEGKIR